MVSRGQEGDPPVTALEHHNRLMNRFELNSVASKYESVYESEFSLFPRSVRIALYSLQLDILRAPLLHLGFGFEVLTVEGKMVCQGRAAKFAFYSVRRGAYILILYVLLAVTFLDYAPNDREVLHGLVPKVFVRVAQKVLPFAFPA